MTTPGFPALYASACRCNAAYIADATAAQAAFEALSYQWLGQYRTDDHQAVMSKVDGYPVLTIAGTRISKNPYPLDLFDDVDFAPDEIVPGITVPHGPFQGCDKLYAWAEGLAGGRMLTVEGHSLGGMRAAYAPIFIDAFVAARFDPPKSGNAAFWSKYASGTTIINGRDPWANWMWDDQDFIQPPGLSILHLHDGTYSQISDAMWDASPTGFGDHSIDQAIMPALKALANAGVPDAHP